MYSYLNFIKELVLCCTEWPLLKNSSQMFKTAVSLVATEVIEKKLSFRGNLAIMKQNLNSQLNRNMQNLKVVYLSTPVKDP